MNQRREIKDGILYFDGCSTVDLAKQYGTPLYVMSEGDIEDKMREIKNCFLDKYPNTRAAYASKAFCTMAIYKICEKEGFCIDIVSGGELHTAIKAGFPAERIEFNGNNKLPHEIEEALDYGIGRFIVDGLQEVALIEAICKEKGKTANILFRVTPGVAASTHDYITTGKKTQNSGSRWTRMFSSHRWKQRSRRSTSTFWVCTFMSALSCSTMRRFCRRWTSFLIRWQRSKEI